MSAGARVGVAVSGPGVPELAGVCQDRERVAQPVVARPAELRGLALARLHRDGGLAGVGGDRVAVGVARAAVADLSQQRRGADHRVPATKERPEDLPVGMGVERPGDLRVQAGDLADQCLQRGYERQHDLRRVAVSTRPARPAGAWRSRASSCAAVLRLL
jgi:hypothetical protein